MKLHNREIFRNEGFKKIFNHFMKKYDIHEMWNDCGLCLSIPAKL